MSGPPSHLSFLVRVILGHSPDIDGEYRIGGGPRSQYRRLLISVPEAPRYTRGMSNYVPPSHVIGALVVSAELVWLSSSARRKSASHVTALPSARIFKTASPQTIFSCSNERAGHYRAANRRPRGQRRRIIVDAQTGEPQIRRPM